MLHTLFPSSPSVSGTDHGSTAHHIIENAFIHAWPAQEEHLCGPFLLRYAGGSAKRANSALLRTAAVAPQAATADMSCHIDAVERWYAARAVPAIFRITEPCSSFTWPDGTLDDALTTRGYTQKDTSLVLSHDLASIPPSKSLAHPVSSTDWLDSDQQLHARSNADRAVMQQLCTRNAKYCDGFVLDTQADLKACGLGIRMHGTYALFGIQTAAGHRRQGHGTALICAMLHRARHCGARFAWLQVLATNEPALRLYHSLGFTLQYRYWYRTLG